MKQRTRILLAVLLALCCCVVLIAVNRGQKENQTGVPAQRLQLSMDHAVSTEELTTRYTSEDLNGQYSGHLDYTHVKDVTVNIDGQMHRLEAAIRDGLITVEEIGACLQTDARNGFCKEVAVSDLGLSYFYYIYPEYQLRMVHDLYETPDGKQHLINSLEISPAGSALYSRGSVLYLKEGGSAVDYLDKEDWGVEITVPEAAKTSAVCHITQYKGQQIGILNVIGYMLYSEDHPEMEVAMVDMKPVSLTMDGETSFTVDWSQTYGELASGEYTLRLRLEDVYTPKDSHPLIRKYYKKQSYETVITIP